MKANEDVNVYRYNAEIELPAPKEYPNTITTRKVDNGFIVTVGCVTVVFNTWTELRDALSLYFKNPAAAEKKYVKKG